jgi:hypothetical protein
MNCLSLFRLARMNTYAVATIASASAHVPGSVGTCIATKLVSM